MYKSKEEIEKLIIQKKNIGKELKIINKYNDLLDKKSISKKEQKNKERLEKIIKEILSNGIGENLLIDYENGLNEELEVIESKVSQNIDYDKIRKILNQNKKFSEIELSDEVKESGDNMKFEAVVGNPPYQDMGGSGGSNDAPIYQLFVEVANKLNANYICMIIKAAWFSTGRENLLGKFRNTMLNTTKIKHLFVYSNSKDVFNNVDIEGGICYFLIDKNKNDYLCNYRIIDKGVLYKENNKKLNDYEIFIRNPIINGIVNKVEAFQTNNNRVESIISGDTPFGIPSNPKTSKKNPIKVYENSGIGHTTALYHIEKDRKVDYIDKRTIKKNVDAIDKYKVFIPENRGDTNGIVLGTPEFANKDSVCSQSYLYVAFDSKKEAENFYTYIKTKFLRVLVASIKITPLATNRFYRFVPLQNFNRDSDIDWSMSIEDIDKQLYKKYKLSKEEIEFIEKNIKPMK